MSDVTRLLSRIEHGDPQAAEQLLPVVYNELRRLARLKLSQEKPGQTLQPTALVHEAYVRLVGGQGPSGQEPVANEKDLAAGNWLPAPSFHSRSHFFAAAAEAMRRILVENARRKARVKHGGLVERVAMTDCAAEDVQAAEELLELEEALQRLTDEEPEKAELVKLRYFVGLTLEEAAEVLGISRATASRHWTYARAWLYNALVK